jgi:hypothetical protein
VSDLAPKDATETEAIAILRAIIDASDQCQGHRYCNHSMEPWQRARRLLMSIDGEEYELPLLDAMGRSLSGKGSK